MTTWPNTPPRFRNKINGAVRSARPAPKTEAQREIAKAKREEHERALETQLIQDGVGFDKQVKMLAMFGLGYVWDFAIHGKPFFGETTHCLTVEVNGGIWLEGYDADGKPRKSGHNSGSGLLRDYEKTNHLLAYRGIYTMHVAPEHIADGRALGWIKAHLARELGQ
jgi:hypothetical protein